jgi:hypothetical protein
MLMRRLNILLAGVVSTDGSNVHDALSREKSVTDWLRCVLSPLQKRSLLEYLLQLL